MKVLRYAFLSGFVLEFMTAAAIGLVAVTLGVRVISGNMPFEVAFLVLLLPPESTNRCASSASTATPAWKAAPPRTESSRSCPPQPFRRGRYWIPYDGQISEPFGSRSPASVSRIREARKPRSRPHARLTRGDQTALVGRSGAGKSTLVTC